MTSGPLAPAGGDADAPTVTLRLFAAARVAAGTDRAQLAGPTVAAVLDGARARWGADFAAILAGSRVWVNGEPAEGARPVRTGDEIAVLPPVSGGSGRS